MSALAAIVGALLNDAHVTGPAPYVKPTPTTPASGGFAMTATSVRPGAVMPATRDQTIPGAVPSMCIFVVPTGGPRATPYVDGGAGGLEEPRSYQIVVRSPVRDFDLGEALADVVYGVLNLKPPAGFFESRWFPPHYLREDDQNQHEFVINGTLTRSTA